MFDRIYKFLTITFDEHVTRQKIQVKEKFWLQGSALKQSDLPEAKYNWNDSL